MPDAQMRSVLAMEFLGGGAWPAEVSPGVGLCLALSACFQANMAWTVLVLYPRRVTLMAMPSTPGWTTISFSPFQLFLLGIFSVERKLLMQCSLLSKISPS